MVALLPALFGELADRSDTLARRLEAPGPAAMAATALAALAQVQESKASINAVRARADLREPALLTNNLESLKLLASQLSLVEYVALAAKERYSAADERLSAAPRSMLASACWPLDSPPVLLYSGRHYWNQPQFGPIYAPAAEDSSLLGLPDLGHLFLEADQARRLDRIVEDVRAVLAVDRPVAMSAADRGTRDELWISWTLEFACDVVATQLFGPAYLWQHLRLSARLPPDPYLPSLTPRAHPIPEARTVVIEQMLDDLAADHTDASEAWESHQRAAFGRPSDFARVYPAAALEAVVRSVRALCAGEGIVPFASAPAGTLSPVANAAWRRFVGDPDSYGRWHDAELARLFGP